MSELSKLLGQAEEVEMRGVKFKIKPLTVADLDLVTGINPEAVSGESLKKLVGKVLKDSFPEATPEEIEGFPLELVNELSEHVARINKFKTERSDAEQKIIDSIKAKKSGTA